MLSVFSQLQAKHALTLPAEVSRVDPSLFAVSGQPTVMEVLHGNHTKMPEGLDSLGQSSHDPQVPATTAATGAPQSASAVSSHAQAQSHPHPPQPNPNAVSKHSSLTPIAGNAKPGTEEHQPVASPFATAAPDSAASIAPDVTASSEHVQDAWVYRDPNWEVQGPFSKADILDWFEGGFFPADLPIRHASNPQADFKPLAAQIKIWAAAAPPGFARQDTQHSTAAPTQPAMPAQQAPFEQQQQLSDAASGLQMQSQPQTDINRTYTLTTAGSNAMSYMGPSSASSAKLDALETGDNSLPAAEPPRMAAEPVGMDLIHLLTRGHSGASHVRSGLPAPGQDPLAEFSGLQQGLSAAAPWGHQNQIGNASSGQFDNSNPILGPVGSGLATHPHDPFASRAFSQPMRQDPPQQHALPAFLSPHTNHAPKHPHSVHQPYASQPQTNLQNLNLGAAGLGMQAQHQHQQASLWVSAISHHALWTHQVAFMKFECFSMLSAQLLVSYSAT